MTISDVEINKGLKNVVKYLRQTKKEVMVAF